MSDDATGETAPTTKNRARHTRGVWFTIAMLLAVVAVFGAVWVTRGREAKAEGCDCEHRVQIMRQNGFLDRYPPAPELSLQERADRENQLVQEIDAVVLGKWEIVDQFVTTTPKKENALAPIAHSWREETRLPCWTVYQDHGPVPDGPGSIQIVQSTCGRKGLYAFAVRSDSIEDPYYTWGFFDLRLKGDAS